MLDMGKINAIFSSVADMYSRACPMPRRPSVCPSNLPRDMLKSIIALIMNSIASNCEKKSSFICDKAHKTIFGLQKKVKFSKILPPEVRFEMFDTMIKMLNMS